MYLRFHLGSYNCPQRKIIDVHQKRHPGFGCTIYAAFHQFPSVIFYIYIERIMSVYSNSRIKMITHFALFLLQFFYRKFAIFIYIMIQFTSTLFCVFICRVSIYSSLSVPLRVHKHQKLHIDFHSIVFCPQK